MNDWIDQIKNVFCVKERERERERVPNTTRTIKMARKDFRPRKISYILFIYLYMHQKDAYMRPDQLRAYCVSEGVDDSLLWISRTSLSLVNVTAPCRHLL
jgi:hypothetical protein